MRVLYLGWIDFYNTSRVRQAAARDGIRLDVLEIADVSFAAEPSGVRVYHGAQDLLELYDVLLVRTFYPYIAEVLTIARLFRAAGKLVVDESIADEPYIISKMHDYLILVQHAVPVPRTYQLFDPGDIESVAGALGYPVVLKGVHGAQGTHVFKVDDAGQLRRRVRRYGSGELIIQEFIRADEDYRVLVIGYKALPILVSRRPPPGEFRTNFAVGGELVPLPLAQFPQLHALAERSARVLRREFAGVDLRFRGAEPVILEVNRLPDFRGFEQATQLDVAGVLLDYVRGKYSSRL